MRQKRGAGSQLVGVNTVPDTWRILEILPSRAVNCCVTFRNCVAVTDHAAVVVPSGNYSLAYGDNALRPRNLGNFKCCDTARHNA